MEKNRKRGWYYGPAFTQRVIYEQLIPHWQNLTPIKRSLTDFDMITIRRVFVQRKTLESISFKSIRKRTWNTSILHYVSSFVLDGLFYTVKSFLQSERCRWEQFITVVFAVSLIRSQLYGAKRQDERTEMRFTRGTNTGRCRKVQKVQPRNVLGHWIKERLV